MNVIFLDFDGVLNTAHASTLQDIERRIAILALICSEYHCKVVIEASAKDAIDEETMAISKDAVWVQFIFDTFRKYGIECIGRTPNVKRRISKNSYLSMWKEDEIRLYLYRHPEIEHYCIIDDDDMKTVFHRNVSDLDKVRDHLVIPSYDSDNYEEEGLLLLHKKEVENILKKDNKIRKYILKKSMN